MFLLDVLSLLDLDNASIFASSSRIFALLMMQGFFIFLNKDKERKTKAHIE